MPGAHPRQVDAGLGAEHAKRQLLLRHLEREDGDADVGPERGVFGDVENDGGIVDADVIGDEVVGVGYG